MVDSPSSPPRNLRKAATASWRGRWRWMAKSSVVTLSILHRQLQASSFDPTFSPASTTRARECLDGVCPFMQPRSRLSKTREEATRDRRTPEASSRRLSRLPTGSRSCRMMPTVPNLALPREGRGHWMMGRATGHGSRHERSEQHPETGHDRLLPESTTFRAASSKVPEIQRQPTTWIQAQDLSFMPLHAIAGGALAPASAAVAWLWKSQEVSR